MMPFLVGMLAGGLTAAFLAWIDASIRRGSRRRRELRRLRGIA